MPRNTDVVDKLQDYAINKTRLGIPLLINWEGIHGLLNADDLSNEPQVTVFPQCLGLGCSFNREFVHEMARCIGKEARALGIRQLYAPNIDIPRDPPLGQNAGKLLRRPLSCGRNGCGVCKGLTK